MRWSSERSSAHRWSHAHTHARARARAHAHTHTHNPVAGPSGRAAGHGCALERAPAAPPRHGASGGLWQGVTPPAGCHHAGATLALTLTLTPTRRAKRAARRGKLAGYFSEEYAKTVGGLESAAGASYAAAVGLTPSIERVLIGGAPAGSCVRIPWSCVWSQECSAAGAPTRRSGSPLTRGCPLPSGPERSTLAAWIWMLSGGGGGAREPARSRRLRRRP